MTDATLCVQQVARVCKPEYGVCNMCIDMCIDMCIGMYIDMCIDMCVDRCTDICI